MPVSPSLAVRLRPFGALIVGALVAFYAPLSATYFTLTDPSMHDPNTWQDRVLSLLISPSFAFGFGSGHDTHTDEFARTYATMWVHSVAGTVALVGGLLQFSTRLRARRPRLHRWTGRAYLLACLVVTASAVSFLLQTPPEHVFSGPAFADVLWLLAAGTLLATAAAFVAIVRGRVTAHLELMALSYALICSAPFLRVGWIVVGNVWDSTKEMVNLTEGIWAGPFLITCAMLFARRYGGQRSRRTSPLVTRRTVRVSRMAFGIGAALLAVCVVRTPGYLTGSTQPGPDWFDPSWQVVALCTVPYLVQLLGFGWLARRAKDRGDETGHIAWRTYVLGLLWAPILTAVGFAFTTGVQGIPADQAWYAAPLGWSLALFAAYVAHTVATAWLGRPTPSPVERTTRPAEGVLA